MNKLIKSAFLIAAFAFTAPDMMAQDVTQDEDGKLKMCYAGETYNVHVDGNVVTFRGNMESITVQPDGGVVWTKEPLVFNGGGVMGAYMLAPYNYTPAEKKAMQEAAENTLEFGD